MNENNIETIDMTEMQKGRNSNNEKDNGGLNLSFFDDMENTFNTYRKFYQETRDMVKEAAKNAIAKAGLGHITFSVHNADAFKDSIVNNKLRLRGVTLSGRDETYTYILAIVSRYEDEAEDIFDLDDEDDYDDLDIDEDLDEISDEIEYPDNVQITLFKYDSVDEAALTSSKCFQYDFEFSKWIPVNVEDISGITAKQESILTGNDKELSRVLSVCIDGLGPMTNKQFENLLAGNKPIIDLYKRTSRFTDIELYDPDTIILIPSMQYEGLSVSYEDGTYRLNSVFLGEVIETVAKIKNIDDIENVLIEMVDKQFYADTIVVTPLSSKAFYVIRSDGASEFFYPADRKKPAPTDEERRIMNEYTKYVNEFYAREVAGGEEES